MRPPEVDDQVMPGPWDGNFIKAAGNRSSAGVLVGCSSRLALLARMGYASVSAAATMAGSTDKSKLLAHHWSTA